MRTFLAVVLVLVLLFGGMVLLPAWLRFEQGQGVVPTGIRLAGTDINGATEQEVFGALDQLYGQPVAVYYGTQRILLRPPMVQFRVEGEAMLRSAQALNTAAHTARTFLAFTFDRPLRPIDIPLQYSLDREAMDNWLADIASRYDRPPMPGRGLLESLTFVPGQPGMQLDLPSSRPRMIAALADPRTRTADLVIRETTAGPLSIDALRDLIELRLEEFPGISSVFVYDVTTGEEQGVRADVAYSGLSTLKIAILAGLYRKLDTPPSPYTTGLITQTMSLSGNMTANELLAIIGNGDAGEGTRELNSFLNTLGLKSTFMAAPYDRKLPAPPRVNTPANSQREFNTGADPYIQTTPREMGLLLAMLVQCSKGGGTFLAAYPGQITPAECSQALEFIQMNEVKELIQAAVPDGMRIVHKHGYAAETHGDVAAIWAPSGPFVLAIFLQYPDWLEWTLSNGTMQDVTKATLNYFTLSHPR